MRRRVQTGPRTCLLYLRVSSREQADEGFSLDAQLAFLRSYCARVGLTILAEHVEVESASSAGRRVFDAVLAELRKGRVGALVVEKSDRLTRNLADMAAVEELRLHGLEVHLAKEGQVVGPDASRTVMLAWELHAMLARDFVRNLREEIMKGMEAKRQAGGWPHTAPLGYLNVTEGKRRVLAVDPERGPLIGELFRLYSTGRLTLSKLADLAHALGLRSRNGHRVGVGKLSHVLRHPLYCGLIPSGDRVGAYRSWGEASRVLPGVHPPLVDRATWEAVQGVLDGRVRRHERGPSRAAYAGLLACGECGSAMTGGMAKGRWYYRCARQIRRPTSCQRKSVREDHVTEQLAAHLDRLRMDDDELAILLACLLHAEECETETREAAVAALMARKPALELQLREARRHLLAGRVTGEEYDMDTAERRAELASVEASLVNLAQADAAWTARARDLLEWCTGAGQRFRRAQPSSRAAIVRAAFVCNPSVTAGIVSADLAQPFAGVALTVIDGGRSHDASAAAVPGGSGVVSKLQPLREGLAHPEAARRFEAARAA